MPIPSKPLQEMTLTLPCATIDYFLGLMHKTPLPFEEVAPHIGAIMSEVNRNNAEAVAKESEAK